MIMILAHMKIKSKIVRKCQLKKKKKTPDERYRRAESVTDDITK